MILNKNNINKLNRYIEHDYSIEKICIDFENRLISIISSEYDDNNNNYIYYSLTFKPVTSFNIVNYDLWLMGDYSISSHDIVINGDNILLSICMYYLNHILNLKIEFSEVSIEIIKSE